MAQTLKHGYTWCHFPGLSIVTGARFSLRDLCGSARLQDDGAHSNSAPTVSAEEVETQLQRILASPLFRNAPRHCRFLSFVVKKTLIGEAGAVRSI